MTRKNHKRSLQRKEQSERDKLRYITENSIYGQVAAFRRWLGLVQSEGIHGNYKPIPYELIDLTASFIASWMSTVTTDLVLITSSIVDMADYRKNVNFIRKTLSKAQVSCSSLICSLWYIDQFFQQEKSMHAPSWDPRDLFLASIVVADKYIADVTWLNSDWSEWTHFAYSNAEINLLEKRFLNEIGFNLYISELNYSNFVSYLEFRLHSRQLLGNTLLLSYRDIDVLSQSLNPIYVKRLKLSLRPFEAMLLLLKQAMSILVVYTAALAALASAGYALAYHFNVQRDILVH
ncbi:Cyclin-U4-1 [Choanephora cucurbitarum]|uniref:Cyclin-U4-1 n=1 Tax=Choanephora cucurbitarum TaxID=101091 RepID=A0A1C7NQD4_9FUNG|nr:Cyclin-U4-1 [Choanephora cucurbitarum]